MCGILVLKNCEYTELQEKEAIKLLNHRGPDNTSSVYVDDIFLGHTRLSILDLDSRSNQPFNYSDLTLVFNGEIYNYLELIKEHNLVVTTLGDTEVVLKMYEKYREKCLQYFNGMFAITIYDSKRKEVFVARDRLGIKPLYYRNIGTSFEYSSEVSPLLHLRSSEFDEFGLRQYKKLRMTLNGYTVYKDIKTFPAGHYSINGKLYQYWNLEIEDQLAPSDDELESMLKRSIDLRMRSDVPVGCLLSGGLDSSILAVLSKSDHNWTVGFEELNEFEWSELLAQKSNLLLHKILIEKSEFLSELELLVKKRREPLCVPNEVLISLMSKKIKEHNTVILSGEGADELFYGYNRIFDYYHNLKSITICDFDEMYCYGTHKDDEVIDIVLGSLPGNSALSKIAYFFQIHHLHGLLRRLDNSTMVHSIEARVPFVDHNIVERLAGVPFDWKMGNSFKVPLKRIYKNILPIEIIERKKVGFPVPLESIFMGSNIPNEKAIDKWFNYNIELLEL